MIGVPNATLAFRTILIIEIWKLSMTYCLGIITSSGLVMAADSRTNAGVDHISTYRKLFDFSRPDERVLILCTSGNLSITQATLIALQNDLQSSENPNLHNLLSMYEVARYVGETLRQIQARERTWLEKDGIDYHCNILLGGQIRDTEVELYMIYSQGNFIRAMPETPFLQIGEIKYGKPILDRALTFHTKLADAAKCALLSIDSTMKSNISVGPPIDLVMYYKDSLRIRHQIRLRRGDPYLLKVRQQWEIALQDAFDRIPAVAWAPVSDEITDDEGEFSGFLNQ
jgi:putative proteasome-type protease